MPRIIQAGDGIVSVLNLGDLRFRLRDIERGPESEWRPRYGDLFDREQLFPSNCFHITTTGASILVDAGDYGVWTAANPSYRPKNYTPPPPLVEQLAGIGVTRNNITHVVITHAHHDHFAGVTMKIDGKQVPTFPRAKYLLGRADWENPEMQKAVLQPGSPENLTLGVLQSAGLLHLVDGEVPLTRETTVIPAPGESPGHTIVRIHLGSRTVYCVGDMFHHSVEVEDIDLMAQWCDTLTNKRSREALIEAALAEEALLLAAHMSPGTLAGSAENLKFQPV